MDNSCSNDIIRICRTCMKDITVASSSFFNLDYTPIANTQLTIRQKLYSCIPELDLSIVSNAVICNNCVDNLLSLYEFKEKCLQSEIQINKYIQQAQNTNDVNLVEVIRFHQPHNKDLDIKVKVEDIEITNFKNENLDYDSSAFNEAGKYTESTEPKYLLKLEKIDTQYVLSAAEGNSDTQKSDAAQNCLAEVIEHQNNYDKNISKTNVYYQCYKCGHKAESKLKLILHLKRHISLLEQQIQFQTGEKLLCSVCKYQCSQKQDLHMQTHTKEKSFSCSVCEHKCMRKSQLKRHIQIHTGEKPFSCSICKYQCSEKSRLNQHIRIHTGEKPFLCSICEYHCSQKQVLKRHMLIHTGEKPFSCFMCKFQCSRKDVLKQHMQIHTGEKPFSCSVCTYQCSQKNNLKQHMRIHTGEKPFSCSVCEYQCSVKVNLKQHMLIHIGKKSFTCSVCEYQCSRKDMLIKHVRIHTGEKPFTCSVCEYQCSRKDMLKNHVRTHTGEKPFSCSVCEYQCNRKCNLKQHMRIHTGENFM